MTRCAHRPAPRPQKAPPELVRALAAEGYSQTTAAIMLGVTRERIRQIANRDGIEFLSGKKDWGARDQIAALHAEGLTDREIAERMGREPATIWLMREDIGLPRNVRRTKRDELCDLLSQGLTLSEAARQLGWRTQNAWEVAKRRGITDYAGKQGPKRAPDEYRACAEKGMTKKEAARHLGVSLRAVDQMARRHGIRFGGAA